MESLKPITIRSGASLGKTVMAIQSTQGVPELLWSVYKDGGNLFIATCNQMNTLAVDWKVIDKITGEFLDYSILFDGYWKRINSKWRFISEDVPYIVYVTSGGSLNITKYGSEYVYDLATGVTKVETLRGWKNLNIIGNDQGLFIAYLKDDKTIYYRNYCMQASGGIFWESERKISYKEGLVNNFTLSLLNDYRLGVFIEDSLGVTCWTLTNRMWAGLAVVPDKIDVVPSSSISFMKVNYELVSSSDKIIVSPFVTVAYLYGSTGNDILSVYNVDNGLGDFGRIIEFTIAHDSIIVPSCELIDNELSTDIGIDSVVKIAAGVYRIVVSPELEYGFNTVTGDITLNITGATNPAGYNYVNMSVSFTPVGLVPPFTPSPEVEVIWNE